MNPIVVYRIEDPVNKDGMWYTKDAIYRKTIHVLCPNGIAKDFPMPKDDLHRKDGRIWQSAGKNIDDMRYWFSASDALSLYHHGFKLFSFCTSLYQLLENEVLFCRDGLIWQKETPLEDIWDILE